MTVLFVLIKLYTRAVPDRFINPIMLYTKTMPDHKIYTLVILYAKVIIDHKIPALCSCVSAKKIYFGKVVVME